MADKTRDGGMPTASAGVSETPTSAADTTQSISADSAVPSTWDEALATLPEATRALYEGHTTGLKNTVTAVRGERDALAGKLTELTKALGKDTPEAARTLLTEMVGQLEGANRRAAFFEESGKPEIGCQNAKAAFAIAQTEGLFDSRGNVNWQELKATAPELFRVRTPDGHAGQGTGTAPAPVRDMNAFIRAASGRG